MTPLLPLKIDALKLFSAKELVAGLRMEGSAGVIKFTLTLRLFTLDSEARAEAEERSFEIVKTYSETLGNIRKIPRVSVLEIWPDIMVPSWKKYYSYLCKLDDSFDARPVVNGRIVKSETIFIDDPSEGRLEIAITQLGFWPEAIACTYQDPSTAVAYEALIFLKPPSRRQPAPTLSWTVGIDFGTTGTRVCYSLADGVPMALGFDSRLFKVSESESGFRTAVVSDYFLPTITVPRKDTSVLSVWADLLAQTSGPELIPLRDGHINFVRHAAAYNPGAQHNWTDLKWSNESNEVLRAVAFLKQLCLHICVEAHIRGVREIKWRFSVPSAFSANDRKKFTLAWEKIANSCAEDTGILSSGGRPAAMIESIAAAIYFADAQSAQSADPRRHSMDIQYGAVCLDIGGGTTDIAIWQRFGLRLFSSVRFAGRDILLTPLKYFPQVLEQLDSTLSVAPLLVARNSNKPKAFFAAIDCLLQDQGERLLEALMSSPSKGKSALSDLESMIGVGIAGIFFYTGMLLRYGRIDRVVEEHIPKFYIAGNGANLFHWASRGRFEPQGLAWSRDLEDPFEKMLKDVFVAASGFTPMDSERFVVELSQNLKGEVAYGLVADAADKQDLVQAGNAQKTIAGEQFHWNGQDSHNGLAAELCPLSPDHFVNGLELSLSLPCLSTFLELVDPQRQYLREEAIEYLDASDIAREVNREIAMHANRKDAAADTVRVDSLFIMALKAYLNQRAKRWALKFASGPLTDEGEVAK
jgi:hypothetical protein